MTVPSPIPSHTGMRDHLDRVAPLLHRLAQAVLGQGGGGDSNRVDDDQPGIAEQVLGAEPGRLRREPEVVAEQRCGIGADAHEPDVAERELPGVSRQHRPARGEDRVEEGRDEDVHHVGVVVRGIGEREHHEEGDQRQPQEMRDPPAHQNLPCTPLAKRLPNSPVGRRSRVSVNTIIP